MIKQLREAEYLSQEELAEMLNVSRMTIHRWETGKTSPSMEKFKQLRQILGPELDELIEDTDDED